MPGLHDLKASLVQEPIKLLKLIIEKHQLHASNQQQIDLTLKKLKNLISLVQDNISLNFYKKPGITTHKLILIPK